MILFEKKYQTFDTVFHHQMKHLEVRQKYSAARRIFNSLLGVSSGDETLHLMFDILHEKIPDLIWTEPGLILAQISGHRYKVRCLLGMQEMNLCFWRIIMKYMHAREWRRESV